MHVAYFAFLEQIPAMHAGYVHTIEMVRNLAKKGVNVILFSKKAEEDEIIRGIDVKNVRFPIKLKEYMSFELFFAPLSYANVTRNLKKTQLIHERFSGDLYGFLLAKTTRKPRILEVNSPTSEEYYGDATIMYHLSKKCRELQFKSSLAIITQTETLARILSHYTETPIYVIPNGVNTDLFRPEIDAKNLKKTYNLENKLTITFVGSFRRWHGVNQISIIVRKTVEKYRDVKFLLVGGGSFYQKLRSSLPSNVKRHIVFTGPQRYEDIPGHLAISDILMAPFDPSGDPQRKALFEKHGMWWCPLKVFEYMASGKPVVSYDYYEIRKIIRNAGLLAKPENIHHFVDCLYQLIEDENLRKSLGRRGRKIAEEEYSWEKRAEETIEAYRRVTN